jgi:hypothetical protein
MRQTAFAHVGDLIHEFAGKTCGQSVVHDSQPFVIV